MISAKYGWLYYHCPFCDLTWREPSIDYRLYRCAYCPTAECRPMHDKQDMGGMAPHYGGADNALRFDCTDRALGVPAKMTVARESVY